MAWVTIDQNATLSEKLKWAENVIQLQKLDLERKRHERSMMRQQLIIHYADYFEVCVVCSSPYNNKDYLHNLTCELSDILQSYTRYG